MNVRTRIAPSPTGLAHVGTAYAGLYNYAFAKKMGGKFVLRIEDTDVKRNVKGAEEAIYEGLAWLGLKWDEGPDKGGSFGPYRQSERLASYRVKAKELEERGLAYEEEGAIRFKNSEKEIFWEDLVRGRVSFPGEEVGDFVIMKSDGYPTYNFAVVIDDILMKISHVIRGEEHISNTPRQIALYQALGEKKPEFAHLPTLRNKERKKLSKRRDPVDLGIYRGEGYLPEALINFLCLLGWSHPEEKEIFPLAEFVEKFSLERVRRAGPVFDMAKLDWLNGEYIRKTQNSKLKDQIWEYYEGRFEKERVGKTVPLVKSRMKKLGEYQDLAGFLFERPKVAMKLLGKRSGEHLRAAEEVLGKLRRWELTEIGKVLVETVKVKGFRTGDFFMDLRVALAGSKVTPPINESMIILGKKETLIRIKKNI